MYKEQYEAGLANRKEVMGSDYVDQALSSASEFSRPLQDIVTENAWGTVWERDGISKKTRSLITLSMLVALKASNELKGHVRGALRNGCSVDEIQEVFLHATVYCGFPAAIQAFKYSEPVIESWVKKEGVEASST